MSEVRHNIPSDTTSFKRAHSEEDVEGSDLKRGRNIDNELATPVSRDSSTSSTTSVRSTSSARLKRYICAECGKAYSRPSLLQQHIMTHTGDKPFQCEICNEAFNRKDHLNRHKLKHLASEDKPFHCAICSKGCNTIQHLKRHEKVHEKSFKCEQCDETFFKHQTLKHHVSTVHQQNKLICTYCNKEFLRPYRLENHKLKLHNESPGYQCTFPGCFKNFKTWSVLSLHTKTDHPKLICKVCGKGCIGTTGLEMHLKVHDVDKVVKLWKCETCDMSFLKKEDLLSHKDDHDSVEKVEKEKEILTTPEITSQPVKKKDYVSLPTTISVDAITKLISNNVEQRTIPCKYTNCSRLFKKNYDLERHLKWHTKLNAELDAKIQSLTQ